MDATISIAGRTIGPSRPCYVIAEAGVNHNGSLQRALALVDAAADAGADAVKFQTFHTAEVISPTAPKAAYQRETTGEAGSQFEMVRQLELPPEAFREIGAHCRRGGITFLSTPFDAESLDFLVSLGAPAIKIASGELTNHALLRQAAATGRPLIVSTGMATLAEVDEAVGVLETAGAVGLVLLHCVSNYPAAAEDVNLRAMHTLAAAFGVPVGYSDHTLGLDVSLAAVALGACVLEKHFTLDKQLPGPDHRASLEPQELKALVYGVRAVEAALGDGRKRPRPAELDTRHVARRSLVLRHDVPEGDTLRPHMLAALRPSGGIGPERIELVVGRRARRPLAGGTRLDWGDLE